MSVWTNPLISQVMSPRPASTSAVSTRRSTTPHRFNTDNNDLTTAVAASAIPDVKEVGQSTSPLFQEREVSTDPNPFCVFGF